MYVYVCMCMYACFFHVDFVYGAEQEGLPSQKTSHVVEPRPRLYALSMSPVSICCVSVFLIS